MRHFFGMDLHSERITGIDTKDTDAVVPAQPQMTSAASQWFQNAQMSRRPRIKQVVEDNQAQMSKEPNIQN
jgi:hypothetical protein